MARRDLRSLTPEQIAELQAAFAPNWTPGAPRRGFGASSRGVAQLPQQALAANAPWRVGEAQFIDELSGPPTLDPEMLDALQSAPDLDPSKIRIDSQVSRGPDLDMGVSPSSFGGGTDWLQELIDNPPQTPARPLSAMGPGGASFDGEDTPEARELIKKGGMRITSAPTDEDLLGALTSERPATMPDVTGGSVDDLIAEESAAMDDEQRAQLNARYAQLFEPRRMSREEALGDAGMGPTRKQGIAALISDAFFGGGALDKLAARGAQARQLRAEARIGDIEAGERAEDRAAQRELTGELARARLGVTARGQDLRAGEQQASRELRQARGEQVDARIVSEGDKNRAAADVRADKNLQARLGPQLSPEDQRAALIGQLSADANVSPAKTASYVDGQPSADTTPEELERLKQFHARWKGLSATGQQKVAENTQKREAGTPDAIDASVKKKQLDPDKRLALRTELGDTKREVTSAIQGWTALTPRAQKVLVGVGNAADPNSFLNALRKANLTGDEQKAAASIWTLLNQLLHRRSGAAVTNQEMIRIADEAGLPTTGWTSVFTSPQVMHQWLGKLRETAIARRKAVQAEYDGLEGI